MSRYTITEFLSSAKGNTIPVMQTGPPYTLSFKMYYRYNSRGDVAICNGKQFWQLRRGSRGTQRLGLGTFLPTGQRLPVFAVDDTRYITYSSEAREDCLYMHKMFGAGLPVPIRSTRYHCSSASMLALSATRVYMSNEYVGYKLTQFYMYDLDSDKKIDDIRFDRDIVMTAADGDIVHFASQEGMAVTMQLYDARANVGLIDMGWLFDDVADNIRANAGLCGECHLMQISVRDSQHVVVYDTRACASYYYEDFYQPVFVVYV